MGRREPIDLLVIALAGLLELPLEHPDVLAAALAVQELAPHLPGLLTHGYGRLSAYVSRHAVENVAVELQHKTRQMRA